MGKPILNDLEHLKQNYRPSDIQKLLNDNNIDFRPDKGKQQDIF